MHQFIFDLARQLLIILIVFSSLPVIAGPYERLDVDLALGEEITNYSTSPNGKFVVYTVEDTSPSQWGVFRAIYSVKLSGFDFAGGDPVKLSGIVEDSSEGRPGEFQISGDSAYVIYRYDHDPDDQTELYSASILGGTITLVHGDTYSFELNDNSRRIVYRTAEGLFSIPLSGAGVPTTLYETDSAFQLQGYEISPDGQNVILTIKSATLKRNQISIVSIYGGNELDLDTTNSAKSMVTISSDSNHVVYFREPLLADGLSSAGEDELYRVAISGGGVTKLSLGLVDSTQASGAQKIEAFKISVDSSHVVYSTHERYKQGFVVSPGVPGPIGSYFVNELRYFRADISGLSPAIELARIEQTRSVGRSFEISGDSKHLVFSIKDANEVDDTLVGLDIALYSVPLNGGAVRELLLVNQESGQRLGTFQIVPDSSRVVFRATTERWPALFSIDISGNEQSIQLSRGDFTPPGIPFRAGASEFRLSPNWDKVIYLFRDSTAYRLYVSTINGDFAPTPIISTGDDLPIVNSNNTHAIFKSNNGLWAFNLVQNLCEPVILGSSVCAENAFGIEDWNTQAIVFPGLEQSTQFFSNAPITNVRLDLVGLTHNRMGDLSIELIAPDGTTYYVVGPRMGDGPQGSTADWLGNYAFSDGGVNLRQELSLRGPDDRITPNLYNPIEETDGGLGVEQLNSFVFTFVDGKRAPVGEWKLRFYDSNPAGGTGGLTSWRLSFNIDDTRFLPVNVGEQTIMVLL